jgi:hypothetical protein
MKQLQWHTIQADATLILKWHNLFFSNWILTNSYLKLHHTPLHNMHHCAFLCNNLHVLTIFSQNNWRKTVNSPVSITDVNRVSQNNSNVNRWHNQETKLNAQQTSILGNPDNLTFRERSPRLEVLLFTREKLHQWNSQISRTCSKRPPRVSVLSPDPISYSYMKVMGAFCNYANMAKNGQRSENYLPWWQLGYPSSQPHMLYPFHATKLYVSSVTRWLLVTDSLSLAQCIHLEWARRSTNGKWNQYDSCSHRYIFNFLSS